MGRYMDTDKLITENMRLVYHLYNKLVKTDFIVRNKDDLISEGMCGLIKAALSYDHGKSKFSTYSSRCIINQMLMYIRRSKYQGREVSLDAPLSLDENGNELTYADIIPDKRSSVDLVVQTIDMQMKFKHFCKLLPAMQQKIIWLRIKGYKQRQIANKLNLSQSYVSRLIRNMKVAYKKMA